MEEYDTHRFFPPAEDMFNAFHFTPLSEVKVVILGQDPYHNDGQAHGLCFSVKKDVEIPPSVGRIFIRKLMMIWDVISRITDIWKNGQDRECFF